MDVSLNVSVLREESLSEGDVLVVRIPSEVDRKTALTQYACQQIYRQLREAFPKPKIVFLHGEVELSIIHPSNHHEPAEEPTI